jgi:hypothetical protein
LVAREPLELGGEKEAVRMRVKVGVECGWRKKRSLGVVFVSMSIVLISLYH